MDMNCFLKTLTFESCGNLRKDSLFLPEEAMSLQARKEKNNSNLECVAHSLHRPYFCPYARHCGKGLKNNKVTALKRHSSSK